MTCFFTPCAVKLIQLCVADIVGALSIKKLSIRLFGNKLRNRVDNLTEGLFEVLRVVRYSECAGLPEAVIAFEYPIENRRLVFKELVLESAVSFHFVRLAGVWLVHKAA